MSIFIFIFLLTNLAGGTSFVYNKTVRYGRLRNCISNKNLFLKKVHKIYHLKKQQNIKRVYSSKGHVANLWNIVNVGKRIGNHLEMWTTNGMKYLFRNNFSYYNYLFNRCKLDRIIIILNTLLYLYLNRINKSEEKKVYFFKGNLVQVKDEQMSEKYKCNYHDIYKNKNYKTLITSIFIHKNILHLYFNMSSLISIYKLISNIYSNNQIITIFLLSGFLSNLISYIYHIRHKKKKIFLNDLIDQRYSNKNNVFNINNKIVCGSSSAIYSLYGMHITHIIFFYFKNNYIVNTTFLYNFFYSFISSLLLENVSHFNHVLGFLCGFFFSFLIILFDNA
ncbi:rhomboid protease ROM7, putative [Plasmodium ovale]|uniref:Rhomboid protease ROM7, putative n=1 Tax=Plasmodium ovale TaxID=36330 RepID=A0A1C3KTT1_PLAOA|nr:rhomboid protease ROM7, putative [Plasmodium ovale]